MRPARRCHRKVLDFPSQVWEQDSTESDLKLMLKDPSFSSKGHLMNLAKTRLPLCMGDKCAAVIVTCLTCLDTYNEDFTGGEEVNLQDEDGILIGARFIEKVLFRLGEILI